MDEGSTIHMETSSVLLRMLNEEEQAMLRRQDEVNDFKRNKLEAEAQNNWDKFYHRNSANFFKDRHWTRTELEAIRSELQLPNKLVFLEAGCGVGNMLFPVSEYFPEWSLCAFDFSKNAIALLDERAQSKGISASTAVIDLTTPTVVPNGFPQADLASLIFVLSAIHPSKHETAIRSLRKFVRPGGYLMFRDYGLYDHAMLRFGRASKLGER
ncbi:Methyltransferase type 12 [Aphelenchoides avenae]|nr:Methyltransferase type 12 [Aphelenchus avenae]